MTVYGKPDHGVEIMLAESEKRFENWGRGIHGGDTLWADPDQTPTERDLVLFRLDGRMGVCPMGEQPHGVETVGPIVWVSRLGLPVRLLPAGAQGPQPNRC